MSYQLSIGNLKEKKVYALNENFRGKNGAGEELAFTNYYLTRNGRPFFGVSGEFHYSRMMPERWEDELIKMKLCGVNTVSTYLFWNHHEEEEGTFDFTGRRCLRKFVGLCQKHGLYAILRVGPFAHGEVRNGGLPDWLYGKPFEVRTTDPGFLACVERFYARIGQEVKGLFFRDGGPIIGVQLDNEYMHSSAPWEMTTGTSNEWVFGGKNGDEYMHRLKDLAAACGLAPVFYTCTAWGGAAAPEDMLPLWGGYAYRPWIFYSHRGEHPATEEYVYQDYHNDGAKCTDDFKPAYRPEERPYACCEMGGGMMCSYYYRFQLPYKSVDAMANIKLGSGCNFLGYYMFHGGSNPKGKHGLFLNEGQVSKISYDYQAVLGEFGQERESYRRLKSLHYFVTCFGDRLCSLQTVLPEGASDISPLDLRTLRFAVRTDGKRGFLFVNNFQDHASMPDRREETVTLKLREEKIAWRFGIAGGENAILPFHFDLDGIDLVWATAQPLLRIAPEGETTYVFLVPEGMEARFAFESGVRVNGEEKSLYTASKGLEAELFRVEKGDAAVKILLLARELADQLFLVKGDRLVFTRAALLEDQRGLRIETAEADNEVLFYPKKVREGRPQPGETQEREILGEGSLEKKSLEKKSLEEEFLEKEIREEGSWEEKSRGLRLSELFGSLRLRAEEKHPEAVCTRTAPGRYLLTLPENFLEDCKDVLLRIFYEGDIGSAFIDGKLIHDNFCNGAPWEIGLKDFAGELAGKEITLYITPLKEGARVQVESAMAARRELAGTCLAEVKKVELQPIYEIALSEI